MNPINSVIVILYDCNRSYLFQLRDNKKSITLNFHFQHTSKTLEDKDVNRVINEIIKVVSKNYSAKLRQL